MVPTHALRVAAQGIFLNIKGEPFPLLLTGTHARQGKVLLHVCDL
jgi:hypothetical protein